jgi:hypothetical protein
LKQPLEIEVREDAADAIFIQVTFEQIDRRSEIEFQDQCTFDVRMIEGQIGFSGQNFRSLHCGVKKLTNVF